MGEHNKHKQCIRRCIQGHCVQLTNGQHVMNANMRAMLSGYAPVWPINKNMAQCNTCRTPSVVSSSIIVVCMYYIKPYLCSSAQQHCKGYIIRQFFVFVVVVLVLVHDVQNAFGHDSARFLNLASVSRSFCFHPKRSVKGACRSV